MRFNGMILSIPLYYTGIWAQQQSFVFCDALP